MGRNNRFCCEGNVWLCQCNGEKRVVAVAPGRLVVQNQVPGMLMAMTVCWSRVKSGHLPYTLPKVEIFSTKRCEILLFPIKPSRSSPGSTAPRAR